jgi:ferritin-like metal-binding protein YciE
MGAATATPTAPTLDGEPGASARTDAALAPMVVEQLRHAHALQVGALQMFDGMLDAVRREQTLPEVADLLTKMLGAFELHREETARHEREVRARLAALGARPARGKELAMRAGALARVMIGRIGGQNHGANARDAYVFEHLEIATYHLLEKVAERAGDEETAQLAREHRGDNCEMGQKIRRNWENVLSLLLASKGVPPARDRQRIEPAPTQSNEGRNC